jgi:MFS family permease
VTCQAEESGISAAERRDGDELQIHTDEQANGDRYGRRSFYAIGLGLFAAASAASALAPSVGVLIAARAVQGAGAALVMTLGLALLSAAFPPEKRGAAIGLFSAVTGIAVAMGPLVGGAIAEGIDWQWIFWLNVPIALAAIPFVSPGSRRVTAATAVWTSPAWR